VRNIKWDFKIDNDVHQYNNKQGFILKYHFTECDGNGNSYQLLSSTGYQSIISMK
jgi:hypothetical protein